jgi:stage II sporulation protein D
MSPTHRWSSLRGVLLGLGAALVLPASGSPVSAVTTGQSYPVPSSGSYTLHGHGFGHGHGMSQYGADGAARQGLAYRRIAGFYYPGTSWGKVTGRVRFLVSADTTRDLVVSPATGLVLRDLASGATYPLPVIAGATRWRLDVDRTKTVVGYFTSAWHRYRPGGLPALAGDGQFRAHRALTLWTPSGRRVYRGALRAATPAAGSANRDTVNVLSLDRYTRGVIAAEMPASWRAEALKAQAVAARTYATWSRNQFPDRFWQICDTSSCQVYRGFCAED